MPTVCLTMIVKNEEHVLARAIASALPFIDTAVIVDTGSTDATAFIADEMTNQMQGIVVPHEWRGFADARTKALELACGRADYALVLDADETLHGTRPELTRSTHAVWHQNPTMRFRTYRYFRLADGWRYERELHEQPTKDGFIPDDGATLEGLRIETTQDGARTKDPEKFRKDAAALRELIRRDPDDANLLFYLGQTLRDCGDDDEAASQFLLRARLPGPKEEVYVCLLEAGRALGRMNRLDEAEQALLRARALCSWRCEAPVLLGEIYSFLGRNMVPAGGMLVETCHYRPGET